MLLAGARGLRRDDHGIGGGRDGEFGSLRRSHDCPNKHGEPGDDHNHQGYAVSMLDVRSGWNLLSPEQAAARQPQRDPTMAVRPDGVPCAPMADAEAQAAPAGVEANTGDERDAASEAEGH